MIKHLVISGGSYNGIKMYGVLHELAKKQFYNIDNIESIYSTSVGSLIGAMLALKIDNDIILLKQSFLLFIIKYKKYLHKNLDLFSKEFFFIFCRVVMLMLMLFCVIVGFSELLVYLDIAQDGFIIKMSIKQFKDPRDELLVILMEECSELIQECSK